MLSKAVPVQRLQTVCPLAKGLASYSHRLMRLGLTLCVVNGFRRPQSFLQEGRNCTANQSMDVPIWTAPQLSAMRQSRDSVVEFLVRVGGWRFAPCNTRLRGEVKGTSSYNREVIEESSVTIDIGQKSHAQSPSVELPSIRGKCVAAVRNPGLVRKRGHMTHSVTLDC
eukprot:4551830-Amphidinium_carterae.1